MSKEQEFIVVHGGIGSIPGTNGAAPDCICPGQIGDLDCWGQPGGYTVDESCPLHGKEARLANLTHVRLQWAEEEIRLSKMEGRVPPWEALSMIEKLADQVKPGDRIGVLSSIVLPPEPLEKRQVVVNGTLVALNPKILLVRLECGAILEFGLDQVSMPVDNKHFGLLGSGDKITFQVSAKALKDALDAPSPPAEDPDLTKEEKLAARSREDWYKFSPAEYLVYCNRDHMRVVAWCSTLTDKFNQRLPFVVDVWDNKNSGVYYEASGGPAGSDWLSEWPKHWEWDLLEYSKDEKSPASPG